MDDGRTDVVGVRYSRVRVRPPFVEKGPLIPPVCDGQRETDRGLGHWTRGRRSRRGLGKE